MSQKKKRLDRLLVERGLVETRTQGKVLVMAGEIRVDGARAVKASAMVSEDSAIEVISPAPYVSRGGYKLAAALQTFAIDVADKVCADVGACTGGFTDVLLQSGASRVYAIDVGYGQLDWKLRRDKRVIVLERTNVRYLEHLPEPVSLASIDVSFISLKLVLPAVLNWLKPSGEIAALIKPQFEAGPELVGKGGIVRSETVHSQVLWDVLSWSMKHKLKPAGLMRSPITGSGGNVEFLAWLKLGEAVPIDLESTIEEVVFPTTGSST